MYTLTTSLPGPSHKKVSNLKGFFFWLNKNEAPIYATTSQYTDTLTISHNGGLNETHTSEVSDFSISTVLLMSVLLNGLFSPPLAADVSGEKVDYPAEEGDLSADGPGL